MKKRILAMLLVVCMLMSMLSVTVWAEPETAAAAEKSAAEEIEQPESEPAGEESLEATVEILSVSDGITLYEAETGTVCSDESCNHVAKTGDKHYDSLQAAINAATSGTVTLLKSTTESVTIAADQNITLDLAGKTLSNNGYARVINNSGTLTIQDSVGTGKVTSNVNYYVLYNQSGATLEITGGSYTASGNSNLLAVVGGTVTITGGTFKETSTYPVIYAGGGTVTITGGAFEETNESTIIYMAGGTVNISGGTFTNPSSKYCVNYGSGTLNITGGTYAHQYVTNGAIAAGYHSRYNSEDQKYHIVAVTETEAVAQLGTGSDAKYCTSLANAVANAKGTADEPAVITLLKNTTEFVNVPSGKYITLDLNGKTLTASGNGVAIKNNGGTLTITDSGSTGKITSSDAAVWASDGTTKFVSGSIESTTKYALYIGNSNTTPAVIVEGGCFTHTGNGSFYCHYTGTFSITGGTFSSDPSSYVAGGCKVVDNGTGTYTVQQLTDDETVAMIGTVRYGSLQNAINAAGTTKTTVTLMKDQDEAVTIANGQDIVLDLNGKTLSHYATDFSGVVKNLGTLTIQDSSAGQTGTISTTAGSSYCAVYNGDSNQSYEGSLTITGGTFESHASGMGTITVACGSVNISGGTFTNTSSEALTTYSKAGTVNITGGTFVRLFTSGSSGYAVNVGGGTVNISGGTFQAQNSSEGYVIYSNPYSGNENTVNITGGTFLFTRPGKEGICNKTDCVSDSIQLNYATELAPYSKNSNVCIYYYVSTSVQSENVAEVNGTGYTSLASAIAAAGDGGTVKLLKSITVKDVDVDKAITLDLNQKTITVNEGTIGLNISSNVTVKNGYVVGNGTAFNVTAGDVTLTGLDMRPEFNENLLITAYDAVVLSGSSTATIAEDTIIYDGGVAVNDTSTLNVYGTIELEYDYASIRQLYRTTSFTDHPAIHTDADGDAKPTVNIYAGAKVISDFSDTYYKYNGVSATGDSSVAIDVGNDATINIEGGTVTGWVAAVRLHNGTLNVTGGTLTGTYRCGPSTKASHTHNASGSAIEIDGAASGEVVVNISGESTVLNGYCYPAIQEKLDNNNSTLKSITITGGTFKRQYSYWGSSYGDVDSVDVNVSDGAASKVSISGGTFTKNPQDYLATGYKAEENASTWTVGVKFDENSSDSSGKNTVTMDNKTTSTEGSTSTSDSFTLPTAQDMDKNVSQLTAKSDVAEVTFDETALTTIASNLAEADGKDTSATTERVVLKVEDKTDDKASLTKAQQEVVKDAAAVVDLSLTNSTTNEKVTFGDKQGTATVTIPMTVEQEQLSNYGVYYIDDNGSVQEYESKVVDGGLQFTTTHFSVYMAALRSSAQSSYTMSVETDQDQTDYNVGDTITANIVAYSPNTDGSTINSFQFKLNYDEEYLELVKLTTELGTYQIIAGAMIYSDTDGTGMTISNEGTTIATATFKVLQKGTATIGFSKAEMTNQNTSSTPTPRTAEKTVNLHNIQVTLKLTGASAITVTRDDGAVTPNIADNTYTLYAKYNDTTLYTEQSYEHAVTNITVTPASGKRLGNDNWSDGTSKYKDFAAITATAFTDDKTFTLQTVQQYTVTFAAGEHGSLTENAADQTLDKDSTIATWPTATPNTGYQFLGWYDGTEQVTTTSYTVTKNVTLTAKFAEATYAFTTNVENVTISELNGLTTNNTLATYGTDITFTATADSENQYVLNTVSYTIDESQTATTLTPNDNGVYTIPGDAIVGKVTILADTIQYYTVTFATGENTTFAQDTPTVAYTKTSGGVLYATLDDLKAGGDATFTVPTPTAAEGYRLKNKDGEFLWKADNNGDFTSTTAANSLNATANVTLTAQTVKTYVVTFKAGENGSLKDSDDVKAVDGTYSVTVDENTTFDSVLKPGYTAKPGYVFDKWTYVTTSEHQTVNGTITADTTATATFKDGEYTATFPTTVKNVSFTNENDGAIGATVNVTHGTALKFKMKIEDATDSNAGTKVTKVSYVIGDNEAVKLTPDESGVYTIEGSKITGAISIVLESNDTYQVTFKAGSNGKVSAGGENAVASETVVKTFDEGYVIKDTDLPTGVADAGYTVGTWDTDPRGLEVTENVTYTLSFKDATYTVSWPEGVTGGATTATHGTDLVFTPTKSGEIITKVTYTVDEVDKGEITPNKDGTYTIEGNKITGKIAISVETITATFTYVSAAQYKALPDGKKMVILETKKLENGTKYTLGDPYGDLYWSAAYGGYATFVDATETDATLSAMLSVASGNATEISYDCDINSSNSVTAADAGIVNDILHNVADETALSYIVDNKMRLELDIDGSKYVSTYDISLIQKKAMEELLK